MNRHSLLFQISLFFIVLMVAINALFFLQYQLEAKQAIGDLEKRFHESRPIFDMGRQHNLPLSELKKQLKTLLSLELLEEDGEYPIHKAKLLHQNRELDMYRHQGYIYFVHKDQRDERRLFLRYKEEPKRGMNNILMLLMNAFIVLFYLYVMKKLKPLQSLKKKIARFSEGELKVSSPQKGKDEIAEVSNEFNHAISKIKTLQESRNLFLRNIMHELKTPIAKGKLITDLMDDMKNQERLRSIFSRFEYLLGEFTKIEQVTSNAMVIKKKKFRVVDILDNALDILLIESDDVDMEINANLEIEADYELMSTAFKNLIDNGLKYGTQRVKIIIEKNAVIIESYGDALENSSFETAFNRTFEDSSKGLGLGLYITHHIVKKHGFELIYKYTQGLNQFTIAC